MNHVTIFLCISSIIKPDLEIVMSEFKKMLIIFPQVANSSVATETKKVENSSVAMETDRISNASVGSGTEAVFTAEADTNTAEKGESHMRNVM